MRKTIALFVLILPFLTIGHTATAQITYRAGGGQNVLTLDGTSTMHDWTMTAHSFLCTALFDLSKENQLNALQALNFSLPVHNLKSEHDGMNDNAYDVLKADQYKEITFRGTSARITSQGGDKYQILVTGMLTISGVARSITLNTSAQVNSDGTISCTGTIPLKLSEFGIERPSFMLGTMKVGDGLKLNYTLHLVHS